MTEITSVWSNYGHIFITEGEHHRCLTCGAVYQLVADADDPTYGNFMAINGDEPRRCTHDTNVEHGYDSHTDCNCLLCY